MHGPELARETANCLLQKRWRRNSIFMLDYWRVTAIGYVSVGHMDESVAPVALDGIRPSLETIPSIVVGLYGFSVAIFLHHHFS